MLSSEEMNVLYSREGCPACNRAKKLLEDQGVEYEERNKPFGVVPLLVGGDSGDSYILKDFSGTERFLKAVVHD